MKYAVLAAALSALVVSGSAQAAALSASEATVVSKSGVELIQYDRYHSRRESRRREREQEARQGVRCGEAMSVVGAARITAGWARKLAIKAWKEQVRFRYGEEYMNFDRAEIVKDQCEESSFGGSMKRCRIVARPCRETF